MADYVNGMGGGMQSLGSRSAFEKNIKNLEKEKKQLAEIAGNKVYDFCVRNPGADIPFTEINSIINEMNLRDEHIKIQLQKIAEYDNEVRRSKGGVQCSCGYVNVVGVRFCENCGNPVVNTISGTTCSCGHVNVPGARFCAKCGSAITENKQNSLAPQGGTVCGCGHTNVPGARFCSKCGNNLI